jgi:hypothetical protein
MFLTRTSETRGGGGARQGRTVMALVEREGGVYCQGVCRDGRKCSSDAEIPEFLAFPLGVVCCTLSLVHLYPI